MDTNGLQIKIDSKGAQQDLAALSKLFDTASQSATRFDKAVGKAAQSTDQNLTRAAKSMEKYAQVMALVSKIKVGNSQFGQVQELGKALDAIGRAKQISQGQINAVKELGSALSSLHVSDRALGVATFLNSLARIRVPSQAQIRNVRDFFAAVGTFKGSAGSESLSRLLNTLSSAKAPNAGTIDRLQRMFTVLSEAKDMPGAGRIANQLDTIALAAGRASRALQSVPGNRSLLSGNTRRTPVTSLATAGRRNPIDVNSIVGGSEAAARQAAASFSVMGKGLDDLTGHFRLTSQAGALFSTVFASFTISEFVRSLYDANIQLLKLQKAVLFATGTFDGASGATDKFISMSQELGLSIKDNIDTYGRFVIASKASNVSLDETNKIYHAVGQAMTVVGASAQQQQLAFYGLTEMLQKGIVYSKEFNRQIGAQLPGNAILGARALSQLEGHVVSVAEFFQKMHTGTLLSPEFVPAWAEQVEKMYRPLLALAQARPDVALQRLNNAFFVFARQVGQGSFMTSIGSAINGLTSKIVMTKDGVTVLTPAAQHLADTLGHGLSDAIHGLGQGVGFLVDHFDALFTTLKGFLAFKLAQEFGAITGGAIKAAAGMMKFAEASHAAAASESTIAAIAAPAASETALSSLAGGVSFGRRGAPTSRRPFGQRLNLPLFNWANESEARAARIRPGVTGPINQVTGAQMRARLASRPSTGFWGSRVTGMFSPNRDSSALTAVVNSAASALSLLGPAATAAAVGLTVFSDKASGLVTGKGNTVTYGDITGGVLSNVGDSVTGWVKSVGEAFGMFGENTLTLGKVVLSVAAVIKAAFSLMFDLAHALGTAIGGALSSLIAQVMNWGKIIADVARGDIGGAVKDWRAGSAQQVAITNSTFGQAGANLAKIFTTDRADNIYKQMEIAAGRNADGRIAGTHADAANQKQLEAALRQQNAASIIENAAQKFSDASIGLSQIQHPIDLNALMGNIRDFASGRNLNAGLSSAQIAANGPGANADVRRIVSAAASREGIDPTLLLNLGVSETHFDPRQYGWNAGGTSARGPFQLTTGALADLSKAGYNTSDAFSLQGSAPLAAAYLRMSQDQFRTVAGRNLRPEEALLPYKFGGAGAARLANSALNPDTAMNLAKNLFPTAAAASANHSLFFAGKDNSTPLTTQQLYAKIVGQAAGSTPNLNGETPDISALASGSAGGAGTETKIDNTANTAFKQFMAVIGEGSPGAAAFAAMQEKAVSLTQAFQKLQATAAKDPFAKTFLSDPQILQGLSHAFDELQRKATEAMDPIGTLTKYNKQANDVTALRVKGLTDEADWQDQVNRLIKEGYSQDEIAQPGRKAAYLAELDRTDVLKSQLDLQKQLNEIEVKRLARTSNSPVDNLVNAQILANAKPGQTLAAARADQTNRIGFYTQGAVAQLAENRSASIQGFGEDLDVLRQSQGLNPQERAYQQDYIKALQGMTSLSTSSLSRLSSAASDADKKIAASYATLKQELENPPGFQRWVDGLEPMSKRLEDMKYSFADGLSDNLTKMATGEKPEWNQMFKGIQQQWVKGQVDTMLGGVFGTIGLTQPQSPEQQQIAAAQAFGTGADTFASAVATFAQTVAVVGGAAPSQAASVAQSTMGTIGNTSALAALSSVPALRGSLDTGNADGLAAITAPTITPNIGDLSSLAQTPSLGAANDNSGGFWNSLGNAVGWNDNQSTGQNIANMGMGVLGLFGNLLFPNKHPLPTYHEPGGIIGQMSQNQVIAGKRTGYQTNILGDLLNMAVNPGGMGGMGGSGGGAGSLFSNGGLFSQSGFFSNLFSGTGGGAGSASSGILSMLSMFSEGGYSTSPVQKVLGGINMSSVPHYAEGTHNTSGIPAVLHPNEAVIPLSRGRKIPVEMNDNARGPTNVSSNITVIAPDPDSFRKASGSIKRDQNRSLKRAATRNLTGT